MPVICGLNEYAKTQLDREIIVGWMHSDEPDNAQSLGRGKGYGPPILPSKLMRDLREIKRIDTTRPVFLNLGQGVAWDDWHGRGVRTRHPEDYPKYVQTGDIISFDIYPVVHKSDAVRGKLWYVPRGVDRLRKWTKGERVVWNCIETTNIHSKTERPTPQQVKAEVWMSIVHGSQGIVYFCHSFEPRSMESALLKDAEMSSAVAAINRQIQSVAGALNSPTVEDALDATVRTQRVDPEMSQLLGSPPIATMVKRHEAATYVFAVRMEDAPARASFTLKGVPKGASVEVLGENRTLAMRRGSFSDDFASYDVHIYRIAR